VQPALQALVAVGGHVDEIRPALADGQDPRRVQIDPVDLEPGLGERHRQRQPGVAEPDDPDLRFAAGDALGERLASMRNGRLTGGQLHREIIGKTRTGAGPSLASARMRALVTGGAGFIGSHLVDALLAAGDDVTVLDDFSTGREENLGAARSAGVHVERADIRDSGRVDELVASAAPETVFHLAAQIDVRRSVADPAFDARTNVEGTVNVLEAARRAGVARFVFTSTGGAIYGESDEIPTPEKAEARPEAPYGQSKFCGEAYCGLYERLHGLSTVSLRYGNVYGPRQDPLGEAGVVAIFCSRLEDGEAPIVFGSGEQTRDYVYVDDVVAANLAAAASEARGPFNIGTGKETSVLELLAALRALAGGDGLEPRFEPARRGELERSCLDVSRARAELGWTPAVELHEGLRRTLASSRT
jgi:UDP-glucose 4-epimerase